MPSRDPLTGKRLSGSAQRARAAARAAPPPRKPPPRRLAPLAVGYDGLEYPPPGYHASLAWAQGLAARGAALARANQDPVRVRLVGQVLAQLARLKGPAQDSETACAAAREYLGLVVDVQGDAPPAEPVARSIWAWIALCRLAYTAATDEDADESQVLHAARQLAQVGLLHPQRAFDDLATRVQKAQG